MSATSRSADCDLIHRGGAGAALHGKDVVGRLHEGDRIDGAAVDANFVVKVRAGRAAGRAHAADLLAAGDVLARLDQDRRHVAVAGSNPTAVVDLDEVAVAAAVPARAKYGAV